MKVCYANFTFKAPISEATETHPYIHKVFNGSLWYESMEKVTDRGDREGVVLDHAM